MRKILLVLVLILSSLTYGQAQDRTVSGRVTATEDGSPLPGVNVVVKGTTTGTATDADGRYSLSIPASLANGSLVFSFIGLQTEEIPIGDRAVIDISLALDATQLSEIIVSGVAGATTREKLTVSVTKIGSDRLNIVPATSLANSLSGKVAGVRVSNQTGAPGAQADVLLRADNNLNNVGSGPLILIDGMILAGGISDINADDIESFEVIKGAAASALYGSRAGNGVIYITTKRGGSLDKNAVKVTARNEFGVQEIANTIDLATHHVYNLAPDWEDFKGEFTKFDGVTYPVGYSGGGYNPNIIGNRTIKADHYMDNDYGVLRDQQDLFFKRGSYQTNYISVSSRSDKSAVFASFENNKQSGIIMNTDGFERQNLRINYDLDITPWLRLSTSNLYVNTTSNAPGSGNGVFFNIALAEPDLDLKAPNPDGQPYFLRMNHWDGNLTNPLYGLYKAQRNNTTRRWIGNYSANVEFTNWLNVDVSQSFEVRNSLSTVYFPKDYWNATGGPPEDFGMIYNDGSLTKSSGELLSKNTQVTFNLGGKVGDFSLRGKLSYLYEDRQNETFQVGASVFSYANVPDFDNFITDNISQATSSSTLERAQNYFAILGADWKDKILFDGMFRYDGSSLFGEDARWNPYYRVSAGYRISQDFTIPGIDELKIRAAYGTAGIRPGYDWQYETFTFSSPGTAIRDQKGNSLLKPSQTAETELGLNVSFLKNFTFEAVYAQSKTTDQFLDVQLIPFLNEGFRRQWQNAGTVESKTFEMTLDANWLKKNNFTWSSRIVFSRIRQEITDLPIPAYVFGATAGGAASIFYVREGETYGAMYGNTWVRSLAQMEKQLPVGTTIADFEVNSDGYVIPAGSEGTLNERAIKVLDENGNLLYTKIGDGNADFNMGIANTLTYKGFSLYLLLDIKKGGDVYNGKGQWITRDLRNGIMDQSGVAQEDKKAYDYWVNFYDVNAPNSYWVEDGSFMKIRELAIGYSVPRTVLNSFLKGTIKGANLKLMGRNLHTFTKYTGYDPEVGSIREPYDNTNVYPNFRNMSVSLTLDF